MSRVTACHRSNARHPEFRDCDDGLSDVDQHTSLVNAHRECLEIDADRRALGLPCRDIEATVMLGTFDCRIHEEAIRKVNLLMGAEAFGRKVPVVFQSINSEAAALKIEPLDFLAIDIRSATRINPLRHNPFGFLCCA